MLVLLVSLLTLVDARCWCASFIRSRSGNWIRKINTGCNDIEMFMWLSRQPHKHQILQKECMRAEWEMVDFVNAVMAYARTMAQAHPGNDTEVEATNHAELSHAIEKDRPVPDCATGLATKTDEDGDEWDHIWFTDDDDDGFDNGFCYSKELLDECTKVKDNIEGWVQSIMVNLERSKATREFVELMRLRVESSIIPTITCRTTTAHVADGATTAVRSGAESLTASNLVLVYSYFVFGMN